MAERARDPSLRRCLASGARLTREQLIRFVVGPDGAVVPDLAERLPGRGLWVRAERAALRRAVDRRLFAKAARRAVSVPEDLLDQTEGLLRARCLDLLGRANRAGLVTFGHQSVERALRGGRAAVLLGAGDAAADGRRKLSRLAGAARRVESFGIAELSLALGRENVVHAALGPGGLTDRFVVEVDRLLGVRDESA